MTIFWNADSPVPGVSRATVVYHDEAPTMARRASDSAVLVRRIVMRLAPRYSVPDNSAWPDCAHVASTSATGASEADTLTRPAAKEISTDSTGSAAAALPIPISATARTQVFTRGLFLQLLLDDRRGEGPVGHVARDRIALQRDDERAAVVRQARVAVAHHARVADARGRAAVHDDAERVVGRDAVLDVDHRACVDDGGEAGGAARDEAVAHAADRGARHDDGVAVAGRPEVIDRGAARRHDDATVGVVQDRRVGHKQRAARGMEVHRGVGEAGDDAVLDVHLRRRDDLDAVVALAARIPGQRALDREVAQVHDGAHVVD